MVLPTMWVKQSVNPSPVTLFIGGSINVSESWVVYDMFLPALVFYITMITFWYCRNLCNPQTVPVWFQWQFLAELSVPLFIDM